MHGRLPRAVSQVPAQVATCIEFASSTFGHNSPFVTNGLADVRGYKNAETGAATRVDSRRYFLAAGSENDPVLAV